MSDRELMIATILRADSTLMALLTGGVYTDQETGIEGLHRGDESTTNAAFDAKGYLLPCAVVRQRGLTPYDYTRDQGAKIAGVTQFVEIYFYQDRFHNVIDAAKQRVYELLEGESLDDSYPIMWDAETPYLYDVGPVKNATTLRMDWEVVSIRKVGS